MIFLSPMIGMVLINLAQRGDADPLPGQHEPVVDQK